MLADKIITLVADYINSIFPLGHIGEIRLGYIFPSYKVPALDDAVEISAVGSGVVIGFPIFHTGGDLLHDADVAVHFPAADTVFTKCVSDTACGKIIYNFADPESVDLHSTQRFCGNIKDAVESVILPGNVGCPQDKQRIFILLHHNGIVHHHNLTVIAVITDGLNIQKCFGFRIIRRAVYQTCCLEVGIFCSGFRIGVVGHINIPAGENKG